MGSKYVGATKSGRAFNGFHLESGKIVHAVEPLPENCVGFWGGKALCGTKCGERSNGWTNSDSPINCPKCLKKLP